MFPSLRNLLYPLCSRLITFITAHIVSFFRQSVRVSFLILQLNLCTLCSFQVLFVVLLCRRLQLSSIHCETHMMKPDKSSARRASSRSACIWTCLVAQNVW
ncbi:hypothetical protein BKA83DRAFT_2161768 [Pisolithus microcarpus]|nr:hypothetical protein BKA83DRAFT_2161768 [Pisolithus microcarpus]